MALLQSQTNLLKDVALPNVQKDTISSIRFSPTTDHVCCTSWDSTFKLWQVSPTTGQCQEQLTVQHGAPLMCCAFSLDGSKLFAGGAQSQGAGGRLVDMTTGQHIPYATQHTAPIKEAYFGTVSGQQNILITGSWDKTVRYWDCRAPAAVLTVNVPERVYSMDVTNAMLTVACAERHIQVYNLNSPSQAYKSITSPLKHQIRCVANFTKENNGYAVGTIEGRVAIQYIEDKDQSTNFTFKCHRVNQSDVYSVNHMSFHPTYGTFSTCGSDGSFAFWDKDSKQKLKTFSSVGAPITSTCFNKNGAIFAYAIGYDWSKGHENNKPIPGTQDYAKVMLHAVQQVDIEPRPNAKKSTGR